jgi:flagellar basal-body rod protein FlgB
MEALFGKTIDMLANMLDYRAKRHQLLTSNVANLDTRDYQPADLDFSRNLDQAIRAPGAVRMRTENPRHLTGRSAGEAGASFTVRPEEGRTSLDREMTRLAENHLQYNMTVEMLARKFRAIGNVLKETK